MVRHLRCVRSVPEFGLIAGDLIEIDFSREHPVVATRVLPPNAGAFLGLEADGALIPLDGVVGVPGRASRPASANAPHLRVWREGEPA